VCFTHFQPTLIQIFPMLTPLYFIVKSAKQNILKFVFNTIIHGSKKKLIKIYQIVTSIGRPCHEIIVLKIYYWNIKRETTC